MHMDSEAVVRAAVVNRSYAMVLILHFEFKSPLMHKDLCVTVGGIYRKHVTRNKQVRWWELKQADHSPWVSGGQAEDTGSAAVG